MLDLRRRIRFANHLRHYLRTPPLSLDGPPLLEVSHNASSPQIGMELVFSEWARRALLQSVSGDGV